MDCARTRKRGGGGGEKTFRSDESYLLPISPRRVGRALFTRAKRLRNRVSVREGSTSKKRK